LYDFLHPVIAFLLTRRVESGFVSASERERERERERASAGEWVGDGREKEMGLERQWERQ
jgi:hypothetical protein